MAKSRKSRTDLGAPPRLEPRPAIDLLKRQIEKGKEFAGANPLDSDAVKAWYNNTRELLVAAFGSESRNIGAVMSAGPVNRIYPMGAPHHVMEEGRRRNLIASIRMLEGCVEQLELLGSGLTPSPEPGAVELVAAGRKVFIVHGRDEGRKDTVARFLASLGLEPVVLHEQPNLGLTLIEKFELYASVHFGVVLLTGDDLGSPSDRSDAAHLRARQNVVFELGYFVGRLGRKMVCTLYEEGVEIPSDYQGIVYIPLDERGAWRMLLARELKAAGFDIDLNRAL